MAFSFGASALPQTPSASAPKKKPQLQQPLAPAPGTGIGAMLQQLLAPQQQAAPGIDWSAIERIVHPIDPGAQSQQYTPGVDNGHNPFSNNFFQSGASSLTPQETAQSQGGNASNQWRGLRPQPQGPMQDGSAVPAWPQFGFQNPPVHPMSPSEMGTPTHSTPFVPPPPRNNPYDDPKMMQQQKHPAHSAIEYLLSTIFGSHQ